MSTQVQTFTAHDLLRMPDDGVRRELVGGEVREMAPAGFRHGAVAMRLGRRLSEYVDSSGLGIVPAAETGFRIAVGPDTVRAPDVAFVPSERIAEVGETDGYWPGAPDLAAEVVSPSDSYREVHEKVLDWLNAGTRMVLVVDPSSRTVTVYRSAQEVRVLSEQETLDGGDVVPGWQVPVRDLFG